MKKKNIIKFGTSLALVAAIGAGATFAYLQSSVEDLSNTFTIGNGYDSDEDHPALVLDEKYLGDTPMAEDDQSPLSVERTIEGNIYTVDPGTSVTKDPQVHLKQNSPNSYIFVKITGVDNLRSLTTKKGEKVSVDLDLTNWERVAVSDVDGIYVYKGEHSNDKVVTTTKQDGYIDFEKIFTKVTIPDLDNTEAATLKGLMGTDTKNPINIYAVAVQYVEDEEGNANYEAAVQQAQAVLADHN